MGGFFGTMAFVGLSRGLRNEKRIHQVYGVYIGGVGGCIWGPLRIMVNVFSGNCSMDAGIS